MRIDSRQAIFVIAVAAAAAATAASALATIHTGPQASGGALVTLHTTSLGRVLADSSGRTLYLYGNDRPGKIACTGACTRTWLPLASTGRPRAGAGVKALLLATVKRKDGTVQVTYHGHPLYTFKGDTRAGQANGEGIEHAWYAVGANGSRVESTQAPPPGGSPPPTTTTTPPTTTSDGGGYGY